MLSINTESSINKDQDPRKIGCGGVIIDTQYNEILLIRGRNSQKWGLPKGRKNMNETLEECASREIWEETGLRILINEEFTRIKLKNRRNYYYIIRIPKEQVQIEPIDTDSN